MLAGDPKPVTRARYDWQVYDPARKEKGGVRWHTVEGPFVLKRKGTYYEMFSGGNWQNISYGVSFAVSDTIQNADEWLQYSDGETTFPLIRTIPEKVIGPGHNSVIRGPNNRELYCVYHRWVDDNRVLAIDRMDFGGGDRMFISGPTHTPQPAPYQPATFIAAGRSIDLDAGLRFLLETSFTGTPTIELKLVDDSSFEVPMPSVTNDVTHHVLLEVDALYADIRVDGTRERVVALPEIVRSVHLNGKAKFFGTAMTTGYELLFEDDKLDERGWSRAGNVSFNKGELYIENGRIESAVLTNDDSELVVNIAFDAGTRIDIEFGGSIILFGHDLYIGDEKVPLPDGFTSEVFHQFRFVKKAGYIDSFLDNIRVAEGVTAARSVRMLISVNGSAKLDMIRSTAI
jgi:hypothetical protein